MGKAIAVDRGGFFTFECWDEQVGRVPTSATLDVPGLAIAQAPATIFPDGRVRVQIPRAAVHPDTVGNHVAWWTFTLPGPAFPGMEPMDEQIEVPDTLTVTTDVALAMATPALRDKDGLPTPHHLRTKQLFGIPLVDGSGLLLTDAAIDGTIQGAVSQIEGRLSTVIVPRVFSSIPGAVGDLDEAGMPVYRVVEESAMSYDPAKFRSSFGLMRLYRKPVRKVHALELWVSTQRVTTIPAAWIKLHKAAGDIELLPDALNSLALGFGGAVYPLLTAGRSGSPIPQLIHVAYTAGPDALDPGMFDVVAWMAAQKLLNIVGDAVNAGVSSLSTSIDGVSESTSFTRSGQATLYAANIAELDKRIESWFDDCGDNLTGIRLIGG